MTTYRTCLYGNWGMGELGKERVFPHSLIPTLLLCLFLCLGGSLIAQPQGRGLVEERFFEEGVWIDSTIAAMVVSPLGMDAVPAVLLLHGFASDRDEVGGLYRRLADELARRGIASLRIDFRGWGESRGAMTASSVDGMVADAWSAMEWLRGSGFVDTTRIAVLGFSLGGAVAIRAAARSRPAALALWSSVGDLREDFGESFWREAAATARGEGEVYLDLGWRKVRLGTVFFDSLEGTPLLTFLAQYEGPVLAVAGGADSLSRWLPRFAKTAPGPVTTEVIPGAGHVFGALGGEKGHAVALLRITADWLERTLKNPHTRTQRPEERQD